MSDPDGKRTASSPVAASHAAREGRFVRDALNAGERAILICRRRQDPVRVPDAALGACAAMAAKVLHIGPPLPEPPELQEMIGTAAGISGGRLMPPQAMAQMLLFAEPRQRVILAIDNAHSLPKRSLSYLALMIELLTTDAPILQTVLASGPDLLETLAQPEFVIFRNRLCRPEFATFQNLQWGQPEMPPKMRAGEPAALAQSIRHRLTMPGTMPVHRQPRHAAGDRAQLAAYAALGGLALSVAAAAGYVLFLPLLNSPPPPSKLIESGIAQNFGVPPDAPAAPAPLTPRQTDEVIDGLIDELVDAVAQGSFGGDSADKVSTLLTRIATLKAGASPEGVKLVVEMPRRFAARAKAAAAAGKVEEARQLEYFSAGDSGTAKLDNPVPSNQREPPLPRSKAMPGASGANGAAAQSPASKRRRGGADKRPEAHKGAAAQAASNGVIGDAEAGPPPGRIAMTAPPANEPPSAPAAGGLPAAAPARVVLDMARRDAGWAKRADDIRELLTAAGLSVANVVAVDTQWPKPMIGYYFQPDREAAAGISRRLEPVLGAVEPELLPTRGGIEPGTIEIAIP